MKTKKATAFWAGLLSMILIYGVTLIAAKKEAAAMVAAIGLGSTIVYGIIGLVVAYSGSNVADNLQKAKFYRPELDKERKDQ